jgi:hypothetical protein
MGSGVLVASTPVKAVTGIWLVPVHVLASITCCAKRLYDKASKSGKSNLLKSKCAISVWSSHYKYTEEIWLQEKSGRAADIKFLKAHVRGWTMQN